MLDGRRTYLGPMGKLGLELKQLLHDLLSTLLLAHCILLFGITLTFFLPITLDPLIFLFTRIHL